MLTGLLLRDNSVDSVFKLCVRMFYIGADKKFMMECYRINSLLFYNRRNGRLKGIMTARNISLITYIWKE